MSEQKRLKELQERVLGYFCDRPSNFPAGRPYNCCESVLLALKEYREKALQHRFGCDWDAFLSDARVFIGVEALVEKYKLRSTPILADYVKDP